MLIICSSSWRKTDVEPLGDRVVLENRRKRTNCWRFCPCRFSSRKNKTAQVVATGQGVRTLNGDLVAPSVKAGDRVLVESHAGLDD